MTIEKLLEYLEEQIAEYDKILLRFDGLTIRDDTRVAEIWFTKLAYQKIAKMLEINK